MINFKILIFKSLIFILPIDLNSLIIVLNAFVDDLDSYLILEFFHLSMHSLYFYKFFCSFGPNIFHGFILYECHDEIIS